LTRLFRVRLACPVFVIVKVSGELVTPTTVFGNARLVGEALNTGPVTALPESATAFVPVLSEMLSAADAEP
jgi:hypothetical protein